MARERTDEFLQASHFHIVDVSPSLVPPFFALSLKYGFASCSGVEITAEHREFNPGNSNYPVHMLERAKVSPITLRRGARHDLSDFYRWIHRHINGTDKTRRNLILIHFTSAGQEGTGGLNIGPVNLSGPFAEVVRVPGRAWILWGCVPTRYAAGDMDAKSSEVVISELEIQPRSATEIALGSIF